MYGQICNNNFKAQKKILPTIMNVDCLKHVRNIPTCTNKSCNSIASNFKKIYDYMVRNIGQNQDYYIYMNMQDKANVQPPHNFGQGLYEIIQARSLIRGPYFSHHTSRTWWMIELAFSIQLRTPHKNPLDLIPK